MTTGNPARLILFFSVPLLIGNIFQQLYFMADMAIVSRTISLSAMAAVGATGALTFLVFGFFFGLTNGFAVITAQRFGAKDYDGVRRSVAVSTLLGTAATGLGMLVSLPFIEQLLRLMNTPDDILADSAVYVAALCWGTAATVFYNLLSCFIRALGDSWTPLLFLVIATFLNIGLDLLFIITFGMGIAGAAWATVLAQALSALFCLLYIRRRFPLLCPRRKDWRFDAGFAWEHLRVALPMAFQFSITAIGVLVMQEEINRFGTVTIAAFTAGARIEQLAVQPMFTLGIAIATFAAQNYGARRLDRVRTGVTQCTLISVAWCIVSGIALALFSRPLVGIFIPVDSEPVATAQAQNYIYMTAALFIILGQLFIYRNVLQGIGRSFMPMMAGGAELVVRIAASILLAPVFGYLGVFWATPLAWVGATALLAAAYFTVSRRFDSGTEAGEAERPRSRLRGFRRDRLRLDLLRLRYRLGLLPTRALKQPEK